jgi:hypothetical protein
MGGTEEIVVPPMSGWQTLAFVVEAIDLSPPVDRLTPVSAVATLSDVASLRILHATVASSRGQAISAQRDLDNIEAVTEPARVWCAGSASRCCCCLLRRERESR